MGDSTWVQKYFGGLVSNMYESKFYLSNTNGWYMVSDGSTSKAFIWKLSDDKSVTKLLQNKSLLKCFTSRISKLFYKDLKAVIYNGRDVHGKRGTSRQPDAFYINILEFLK